MDCYPVYHLAELELPGQWRWTWRACLFSPLPQLRSGNSTSPPFPWAPAPGSFLRPTAPGWYRGCEACRSFLRWRTELFLQRKPSSCSFEPPSAHFSPGRPKARKEAQGCALRTAEVILPPTLWACSCAIHVTSTLPSAP